MKERPHVRTHVEKHYRRVSTAHIVNNKGPARKEDLGMRPPSDPSEFDSRKFTANKGGCLSDRVAALEWALECSVERGILVHPVALSLRKLGIRLGMMEEGQTLDGIDSKTKKRLIDIRKWCREKGFIVGSDGGSYDKAGGKACKFYVDRARIDAFLSFLEGRGSIARRKERPPVETETPDELMDRVERTLSVHPEGMRWLERLRAATMMTRNLRVPVSSMYGVTAGDLLEYVRLKVSSNTAVYRECSAIATRLNGYFGALPGDALYVSCNANPKDRNGNYPSMSVDRVTFRAHSAGALLNSHDGEKGSFEGSERQATADAVFGNGNYIRKDERASMHHRLRCLNRGLWDTDTVSDTYADVFRVAFGREMHPRERLWFKKKLQKVLFSPSADAYASAAWYLDLDSESNRLVKAEIMASRDETVERLIQEHGAVMDAYRHVVGEPVGTRIFFFEGYHMLLVQEALWLKFHLRSMNVYDEILVERKGLEVDALLGIVDGLFGRTFPKVLDAFRKADLYLPGRHLSVGNVLALETAV